MADFTKINSSTPIHDFPEIYNENIDKLVEEIRILKEIIADKDKRIADMEAKYDSYSRNLKTYLDRIIVTKMDKINNVEEDIVNIETRIAAINERINNNG